MTKTKKKKMSKSTFAIIIMAVVMVAMLAFGGTYAYFTATATKKTTGEFTTGSIKLESNKEATFVSGLTNVVPGDALTTGPLTLTTTSAGTDSYIAIKVTIKATDANDEELDLAGTSLASAIGLLATAPTTEYTGSTWVAGSGNYTNVFVLATTDTDTDTDTPTAVATNQTINITDKALIFKAKDNWDQTTADTGGDYISDSKLMGATLNITIEARSVQSKNWNDGSEDASATGTAATVDGIAALLFPFSAGAD